MSDLQTGATPTLPETAQPPAPAPAPAPEPAAPAEEDPFDRELRLAREAEAAEEKAKTAPAGDAEPTPEPEPAPAADPAKPAEASNTEPANEPAAQTAAKQKTPEEGTAAAIAAERRKRQEAEERAAEAERRLDEATRGQPQQPQRTIEDVVSEIDRDIDATWKLVDEGKLTISEARRKERDFEQEKADLLRPAPRPVSHAGDIALAEATANLAKDNGWVENLSQRQLQYLQVAANDHFREQGIVLSGPRGSLELRRKVIEIGKAEGWDTRYAPTPAAPAAAPAKDPAPPAASKGPTAAQREQKIEAAAKNPPTLGGAPAVADAISEERIASMTDEEIAALPEATRRKFAGLD